MQIQQVIMKLILVPLFCSLFTLSATQEWNNTIYIINNDDSMSSCDMTLQQQSTTPCNGSLNMALQTLATYDSTVIYLYPGLYTIYNVTEISGRNNIAIIGVDSTGHAIAEAASELLPTIHCSNGSLLVVHNSTDVILQSLKLQNCGDIVIDSATTTAHTAVVDQRIRIDDCENVILRDLVLESTSVKDLGAEEDCLVTDCLNLYSTDSHEALTAVSGQPVIVTVGVIDNCTSSSLTVWKNDLTACLDPIDGWFASFDPLEYQQCANLTYQDSVQMPGYPFILYQRLLNTTSFGSVNISISVTSQWELINNQLNFEITVDSCSFPFIVDEDQHKCVFQLNKWYCCADSSPTAMQAPASTASDDTCDTCTMQSTFIKPDLSMNCLSQDASTTKSDYERRFYLGYSHVFYECSGCPSFVSNCTQYSEFDPLNLSSISFCASGREGRLCGACEPGKGVPINQLNNCVDCSQSPLPGIVVFILIQLIPSTIMVLIIIIFGINLNQGFIIAAVYFFQITGVVYPGLTFNMVESYCGEFTDYNLGDCIYHKYYHYIIPNTVFNWNFIAFLMRYPVCITPNMTPLEAIVFWYLIPFYPMLLMVLIYAWIRMYDRGYRCVVRVSRPVHYRIARFWRTVGIEASLFQSMASIYTLSFTQFAATSFQILHPTKWSVWNNSSITGIVSFNDGTVDYFGWPHALLAITAIIILAVFVVIPVTFIQLCPFQFFQRFLSRFHLRKPALVSLMDIFTGPFKSKSEDSFDYRYFAGFYFLLRIMVLVLHYIPYDNGPAILFTQEGLFLTFGGMIMIFRPYKRNIYNFGDFFVVVFLAFSNILMLYIRVEYTKITILAFSVLLYLILLIIYLIHPAFESIKGYIERREQLKKLQQEKELAAVKASDGLNQFIIVGNVINQLENDAVMTEFNDEFPDRLENPDEYERRRSTMGTKHKQLQHANTSQSTGGSSTNSGASVTMLQDRPLLERPSIQ